MELKLNKPVKITENGRHQGYIDLHRTFTGRLIYNTKRAIRWTIKWLLITTSIGSLCFLIFNYHDEIKNSSVPIALARPTLESKIEKLKNKLVEDIRNCERSKYSENDGIIIFDSNEEASIGTLQFQRKTVIHYYKVLYQKNITPKEAILISLDDTKAKALAKDIIFNDSKGWRNWYNCGMKKEINAQAKVEIIKELEQ